MEYTKVLVVEVQALGKVLVYTEMDQEQVLELHKVVELERDRVEEQVQVCIEGVLELERVLDMAEEQEQGIVEELVVGQEYKQVGRQFFPHNKELELDMVVEQVLVLVELD